MLKHNKWYNKRILDRSRFIELREQNLASGLAKAKIIPRFINELNKKFIFNLVAATCFKLGQQQQKSGKVK